MSLSIIGMVFSAALLAAFIASGQESLVQGMFDSYDVRRNIDE